MPDSDKLKAARRAVIDAEQVLDTLRGIRDRHAFGTEAHRAANGAVRTQKAAVDRLRDNRDAIERAESR